MIKKKLTRHEDYGGVICLAYGVSERTAFKRLNEYEDTKLTPQDIREMINDLHALMWFSGDGCNICAHKTVEQRKPYVKLGCELQGECVPKWEGLVEKNDG